MSYSYTTTEGIHIIRDLDQKYKLETFGTINRDVGSKYDPEMGDSYPVWTKVPTRGSFDCLGLPYDSIVRVTKTKHVNSESYYLMERRGKFGILHAAFSSVPDSGVHCCHVLMNFDRIVMDGKSLLICARRKHTYGLYRPHCDGAIHNRKIWQLNATLESSTRPTGRFCESRSLDKLLRKTGLKENERLCQLFAGLDNGVSAASGRTFTCCTGCWDLVCDETMGDGIDCVVITRSASECDCRTHH